MSDDKGFSSFLAAGALFTGEWQIALTDRMRHDQTGPWICLWLAL